MLNARNKKMIISKTPFRISFAGGGTDLPSFYRKEQGAVTSTAIDRFMYVLMHSHFEKDQIRLAYTKTEIVNSVHELQHELIREAMKLTGVTEGVEIATIADVPAGTGLGSSSSLTVGALNALYAYRSKHVSEERLADEACRIEIDIVKEPIGKQDQYIAAYGGLKHFVFNPDDTVDVQPIICSKSTMRELDDNLLMFYTGKSRRAFEILKTQSANTEKKLSDLIQLRELAFKVRDALVSNDLASFGQLLHKGWLIKKNLTPMTSNELIDRQYELAMKAGALGGKLLGAGGGGFLMFYVPQEKQENVRNALCELREEKFRFHPAGSRITHIGD